MTAPSAVEVLAAHFWADLAGSCSCGWLPDGPRRSGRREHARHVAKQLILTGLITSGDAEDEL